MSSIPSFFSWLDRVTASKSRPYWTDLRSFSNSPVVRATILVPFIGYWIILNDTLVAHYSQLSCFLTSCKPPACPIEAVKAPDAPWRLFATFFGLSLLGLGSFTYQMFCPRVVKDNADATAYSRAYVHDISGVEIDRIVDVLKKNPETASAVEKHVEYVDKIERARVHGEEPDLSLLDRRRDLWRNFLQTQYDDANALRYPARLVAYVFYIAGFGVLVFPTADVFFRVCRVLWREVF